MFESFSTEIKILSAKIHFRICRSSTNSKISNLPLALIVSPKVLLTATIDLSTNDYMKLHPSIRGSVKVTNFTHSIEFSMPKVVPTRLVFESTVPKKQLVPKSYFLDHRTNQICYLRGQRRLL
ncbi:unnamed protein product [Hymenolepis diminuta]|uniref:Uncharacterized protein n=1 Tax=Hymenolepis diminuta TaxID=6216 RepID=A0A564Z0Q2_HYMDI|nr:unnamed protein product [Hymenolepis diminuta]